MRAVPAGSDHTRGSARAAARAVAVSLAAATLLSAAGCAAVPRPAPHVASREVLGTAITVTVWGDDPAILPGATEAAFAEMAKVEANLDPYDATSAVSAINASPYAWHPAPRNAIEIIDRVSRLGVGRWFSPALLGVTRLYDFGGRGSVPATASLAAATTAATWATRDLITEGGAQGSWRMLLGSVPATPPPGSATPTGTVSRLATAALDFGGAAKGLAIDRAMSRMRETPGVRALMITAGSSTQVWGAKPDGTPWRIGVEDPRETGRTIAIIGSSGPGPMNVSTSGDYQLFFERDGVRYHHILDPATGRPARGLRSLTVYGSLTGLDADILSTALFVMGPSGLREAAQTHRIGIYAVDDRGRVIAFSAPNGSNVTFERVAAPAR
jgi:thiamine biosynthesis lipoprotein